MKNVQIVTGAIETLNEKIGILQEEYEALAKQKATLEKQILAARAKNAGVKIAMTLLIIIGSIFFILTFAMLSENEPGSALFLGIFALLFIVAGASLKERLEINTDYLEKKCQEMQASIDKQKEEIDEYKTKKREIILEQERKLSEEHSETIDIDFSFDDVKENKECPACAELVKAKAKICRYCGYEFEQLSSKE